MSRVGALQALISISRAKKGPNRGNRYPATCSANPFAGEGWILVVSTNPFSAPQQRMEEKALSTAGGFWGFKSEFSTFFDSFVDATAKHPTIDLWDRHAASAGIRCVKRFRPCILSRAFKLIYALILYKTS